ncbi:MAG: hypothetical protein A3E79_06310 [Burkholderiales bacterium RIFCSPHIGHO2_12_FULL_61_11]|nr:MAG: hypothetical protein A3E79_06310 [Burkholderiales bacterium RIFCSPHIGHO2_12_FULL_61_11]
MALPTVGDGYQIGDGNTNEPKLGVQGAPTEITDAATITAAQLKTGLLVLTSSGGDSYTLPTVALWETSLGDNVKVNAAFDFYIVSLGGTSTLAVGTGWTIVGHATMATVSGHWRARKTAAGAWTAYRLA